MQIRAATVTDLASIVEYSDLAFAYLTGHSGKSGVDAADDLRLQILEGSIQLICDGEDVLGYISLYPAADQMFIDTLAVLQKHHRRGLGSRLLGFADGEALRRGLTTLNLFTKGTVEDNLAFYPRRGYRETGRCNDDGFCRVFYSKDISLPLANHA